MPANWMNAFDITRFFTTSMKDLMITCIYIIYIYIYIYVYIYIYIYINYKYFCFFLHLKIQKTFKIRKISYNHAKIGISENFYIYTMK